MTRKEEGERWALDCVRLPGRPQKPRDYGLTIAADRGLGPNGIDDLILTAGEHIDIAKFAMGVSRLMPASVVRERIERYRKAEIPVFLPVRSPSLPPFKAWRRNISNRSMISVPGLWRFPMPRLRSARPRRSG